MDKEQIKKQAEKEYKEEIFREAVEKYKEKLRTKKSIWERIFPYKIIIVRRK